MRNLKHTWNEAHVANLEETLYIEGWNVIQEETERLLQKAWDHNLKGNQVLSDRAVSAANYHYYLFFYVYTMKQYLERLSNVDDRCDITKLEERFDIDCIEKHIECNGIEMHTNYKKTWEDLLDVFGISTQREGCGDDEDCCLGISEMIINDFDDCKAFIVGDCSEQTPPDTLGEFAPCEFPTNEIVFGDISNDECPDVDEPKNRCN